MNNPRHALGIITKRMDELGISTLGLLNGDLLSIDSTSVYYTTVKGDTLMRLPLSKLSQESK